MNRIAAILFACLCIVETVFAGEAVQVSYPNEGAGISPNGAGFAFRARTNLLITALGYQFNPDRIINYNTTRVDVVDAAGTILAYAITSTNSSKSGMIYYEPITPLVIPAGTTNFVRGYIWQDVNTNVPGIWLGGAIDTNQFTVASELEFLGSGFGVTLTNYYAQYFLQGVDFQFSVIPSVQLQISLTTSNTVQLSWRADAGDYVLQTAPALGVTMTNVLEPPQLSGDFRVVAFPLDGEDRVFRLIR